MTGETKVVAAMSPPSHIELFANLIWSTDVLIAIQLSSSVYKTLLSIYNTGKSSRKFEKKFASVKKAGKIVTAKLMCLINCLKNLI